MNDDPKRNPEPEAPPSQAELRAAAELARGLEDGELADGASEEAREALQTVAMLRAARRPAALQADRVAALVEQALAPAAAVRALAVAPARRRRRLVPALAAAASVMLVAGAALLTLETRRLAPVAAEPLPIAALSRPSDDLLGRPIVDRAGAAARLDRVFDDRLGGLRMLRLAGGAR